MIHRSSTRPAPVHRASTVATLALAALTALAVLAADAGAQGPPGRRIEFPDVPGYRTLKCDFHIHTVFSDGFVWPDIRVREALADGLDAIALTEHIEYQPHSDDIPHPDRNRSYEIARPLVEGTQLLLVHGAEITRDMPPGHINAIFIEDANAFLLDDPLEQLREARRQGAFVFWNHPNWTGQRRDGIARMTEMHESLLEEGLIHGVEVINDLTFDEESLQLALDRDLTILGTSDIHGLVDWRYDVAMGGHRPVMLVFAEEKTEEAIRDALVAGRTVAASGSVLAGREEHLKPLVEASIEVVSAEYGPIHDVLEVTVRNLSSASFLVRNVGAHGFYDASDVRLWKARSDSTVRVKTGSRSEEVELDLEVLNATIAPRTHPTMTIRLEPTGVELPRDADEPAATDP